MTGDAQARAWANKVAKGFNTTDVPMEFGLLVEEIGEAFSAWRKGRPGLGGELADVAIFLLGLAQMTGVDLQAEIEAKLAVKAWHSYSYGQGQSSAGAPIGFGT
jgi:NTP pyrophosphatase (non-canonical NTP hydrolase)